MTSEDKIAIFLTVLFFSVLFGMPLICTYFGLNLDWFVITYIFSFIIWMASLNASENPTLYNIKIKKVGNKEATFKILKDRFRDYYKDDFMIDIRFKENFPMKFYFKMDDYKIKMIKKKLQDIGTECEIVVNK